MILKKLNIKYVVVGLLLIASILVAFQPSQNALAGRCDSKHTVRLNDTFLKIIKQYDLTPTELIQANNLVGPDYAIYVGQTLCIPPASKSTTTWWLQSYMTRPAGVEFVVTMSRCIENADAFLAAWKERWPEEETK